MVIQVVRSTIISSILVLTTWMFFMSLPANAAAVVGSQQGEETSHRLKENVGFLNIRVLPDGERERRLHYRHVSVIETTARTSNISSAKDDNKNGALPQQRGLRLLQITDGRHFLQSIYDKENNLMDCEYVRDKNTANKFLKEMKSDFDLAHHLRRIYSGRVDNLVSIDLDDGFNKTILLRERDITEDVRKLLNYEERRRECKKLHQKIKRIAKSKEDRKKRDLPLIYPGTNWCGVGTTSEKYNDLGLNTAADRCCRQHDHCPLVIEGFATKYNHFNYRFHTLSHCDCDERFRTCLKMVDNGASNLVGKLFFNIVQMKCFVLKSEKICTKRAWWGRCLKHGKQLNAHLKDVLPY